MATPDSTAPSSPPGSTARGLVWGELFAFVEQARRVGVADSERVRSDTTAHGTLQLELYTTTHELAVDDTY